MTKFFCGKYANSSGMMRNNGSTLRLRLAADSFQFILCVCFKVVSLLRFACSFCFSVPGFTDSGFSCPWFYRFRLFMFRVLQIPAFRVPGFTDSAFSCCGFYRFRLFMFRVLQIPSFHVPGFTDSGFSCSRFSRSSFRSSFRSPIPRSFFYR